jgi:hypothetical protein
MFMPRKGTAALINLNTLPVYTLKKKRHILSVILLQAHNLAALSSHRQEKTALAEYSHCWKGLEPLLEPAGRASAAG